MLLNAALVLGTVQMALASASNLSSKNEMNHFTRNKNNMPCKHASSAMHHVRTRKNNNSAHIMNHSMVTASQNSMVSSKQLPMTHNDESVEHVCDCPKLCSDCCGDHAIVALLDVNFLQVVIQPSNQLNSNFNYYTPISLPIETPPPVR